MKHKTIKNHPLQTSSDLKSDANYFQKETQDQSQSAKRENKVHENERSLHKRVFQVTMKLIVYSPQAPAKIKNQKKKTRIREGARSRFPM